MGLSRRTFNYLDEENFVLLYKAFVRPHLEYGNVVWSPHKVEQITALENVQRRATKLVPTIKDLPYEERLRHLKLRTLAYRRLRGDMIETYKMFNYYDPDVALNLARNTRGHNYILLKRRSTRDIGKYAFSSRIVQPWKSLNNHIVCSPNLKTFESRLDRQWRSEDLYFDYRAYPPQACSKEEPNPEA
jgi:ribonuclease P/MRP protein subunit RPP40